MNTALALLAVLSFLCATFVACQQAEMTFGVKPTDQHLYNSKPFKCDNGGKILKQKQINDDYCDCADGTDEPGTSACDNGRFWCENTGHVGQFIFSSRVNDGICDCCDGTDERYSHKTCEDNCWETGKETRRLQAEAEEKRRIGTQKKQELIEQAKVIVLENVEKLKTLRDKLETLKAKKEEATRYKDVEELIETEEKNLINKDGYDKLLKQLALDEAPYPDMQKWLIDFAREQGKEMELVEFLRKRSGNMKIPLPLESDTNNAAEAASQETVINADGSTGKENADPMDPLKKYDLENMNSDELLAAADEILADTKKVIDDNMYDKKEDESDIPVDEASSDFNADDKSTENETEETEEEKIKKMFGVADSTTHTRAEAAAAREEVENVEREINEAEQAVKALEEDNVSSDRYGKDNEYLPLKDKCFEKRFQGYNYNFCFYGSAKQDSNNLGSWDGLEVDATAGTTKAIFKNGASCWNGPSRSLHVTLECGSENDILDVYEPSMCEYHMKFSTPASC
eukprot:g9587.t1